MAKKEVAKEKQNATVIADSPCFLFIMHYVSLCHNPIIITGHKAKDLHNFVVTRKKGHILLCFVDLTALKVIKKSFYFESNMQFEN